MGTPPVQYVLLCGGRRRERQTAVAHVRAKRRNASGLTQEKWPRKRRRPHHYCHSRPASPFPQLFWRKEKAHHHHHTLSWSLSVGVLGVSVVYSSSAQDNMVAGDAGLGYDAGGFGNFGCRLYYNCFCCLNFRKTVASSLFSHLAHCLRSCWLQLQSIIISYWFLYIIPATCISVNSKMGRSFQW